MHMGESGEELSYDITSLSAGKQQVLFSLQISSGVLSVLGSLVIIFRVLTNPIGTKSYERTMLGLSVTDIISSIGIIMTPFMLPSETSHRIWAIGNELTCDMLGWVSQLSIASVFYNGCLSYYFLATVRYNMKAKEFAARFEPYIHGLTIFYFLFMATIGVMVGLYSEIDVGLGCWIGEVPTGCVADGGGCIGTAIAWVFGGVPLMFTSVSLPMNNFLILQHVKRKLETGAVSNDIHWRYVRRLTMQGFLYVLAFSPQLALQLSYEHCVIILLSRTPESVKSSAFFF